MRAFSQLLDDLVYTRSRNTKLKLIGDYLKETPDPDRGYGLAALTGTLDIPAVKGAAVRAIAEERVDPVLLYMSRDYVGDMAETVALLWPTSATGVPPRLDDATIRISDVVERLRLAPRLEAPRALAAMMDHLDASGRFALLKLATGALRVGIQRATCQAGVRRRVRARGRSGGRGLARPAAALSRSSSTGPKDARRSRRCGTCRCSALHARPPARDTKVSLDDYAAEWKWDGIRVQLVHAGGQTRLYSRAGDDISAQLSGRRRSVPDHGVLDGELLVRGSDQGVADMHGGAAASFNALQQRLGRKTISQKMLGAYPAFVRLYDILFDGDADLRELGWDERRKRLERFAAKLDPERFDVSQLIDARSFEALEESSAECARREHRGDHAQAPRQRLRGGAPNRSVVQVEAGPADRRLRAHVRRSAAREAIQLLSATIPSAAGANPANCSRSARPISDSPTRS